MRNWIQAARVFVIGASVLPAVFGALLAYYEKGTFDILIFILTVIGVALVHTAANLFNDYYDFKSGADIKNTEAVFPFSGGSRVIVEGKITPEAVYRAAVVSIVIASIIGIYLSVVSGVWLLFIGLFGVLTSIFYVHPKFSLLKLGIGELIIGLDFGILTVSGAYFAQIGSFSLSSTMASIPVALIIALILMVNEFPDYNGDKLVEKTTIVVRLGRKRASLLLSVLLAVTAASILANVLLGFADILSLFALLTLPFISNAIIHSIKFYDNIPRMLPANISVINSHLFINLYLALSCLNRGDFKLLCYVLTALVFIYQLFAMGKLKVYNQFSIFKSEDGMVIR